MGNFYVNYTLRGVKPQDVATALAGRRARVTPENKGCVVIFDEASDAQNSKEITDLATKLSKKLKCPLLLVLNHDDDILWYQLYLSGKLIDKYDSNPDYFENTSKPRGPTGGDAAKLCAAFGGDPALVEKVFRRGYVFAVERHAALVEALGTSEYGVGTAYQSFDYDEYPEGLSADDILEIGGAPAPQLRDDSTPDRRQYQNTMALFQAAATDDVDAIGKLVEESGVDPNVTAENGQTPLHNSCLRGAVAAAKALLDVGADPNQRYTYGAMSGELQSDRTALMYAASAEIVRLLLERGADPNAQDAAGYTPLMQAAKRRDLDAVELLLAAGANPLAIASLTGGKSRTARGFAEAWRQLYQSQPPSPEVLSGIDKAQNVVERLRLAEQATTE